MVEDYGFHPLKEALEAYEARMNGRGGPTPILRDPTLTSPDPEATSEGVYVIGTGRFYKRYFHHGRTVWVRADLKGQHRQHCLCFVCALFTPEDREANCPIANALYAICCGEGVTTPVRECGPFRPLGLSAPLEPAASGA